MNAIERTAAKQLLGAWNRAVVAWRCCWYSRREYGFASLAARHDERKMDAAALEFSRAAGWYVESPAGVARGD